MKKILALVLTALMLLGMTAAFAATGDQLATAENTISATGVESGDTVYAYQLVQWTNGDWALTALGTATGISLENLIDGITEAEATTIATALANASETYTLTESNGTWTKTNAAAGMYYLKAVANASHKDIIYNPAFVSADYKEGGNTVDFSDTIGTSAVVKKSSVPFDKEVTGADKYIDTKPGDEIPYQITTTIPSYGTTFINPVFTITDTLSDGLELMDGIKVVYGDKEATASNADVTITPNSGKDGFTVAFTKAYLTGLAGATPDVTITYKAKVTTQALDNVTFMDNKAHLEFSNTPTTTSDKDDITRHYTFSIDANLNGGNHGGKRTRELIKVGVNDKNEVVTAFTAWEDVDNWTTYTPLEGATFSLTDGTNTWTATSDENGYISFHGLDVGEYTLTETAAPAGYVKDGSEVPVVITATYRENTDILESYKITVNGQESRYTMDNMSDSAGTIESITNDVVNMTFPFVNTPGTELPSTGGMGTTILYVGGSILVLLAVVLLVTKRRMNAND